MRELGQLTGQIQQQAMVMTFSETFWLLEKPQPGAAGSSAGH
ncbi:hypothetical protein [Paraburkholderia translucens]|nr:hypothetical protein [Paraburkholderia sp. MMS20-SJTN17]